MVTTGLGLLSRQIASPIDVHETYGVHILLFNLVNSSSQLPTKTRENDTRRPKTLSYAMQKRCYTATLYVPDCVAKLRSAAQTCISVTYSRFFVYKIYCIAFYEYVPWLAWLKCTLRSMSTCVQHLEKHDFACLRGVLNIKASSEYRNMKFERYSAAGKTFQAIAFSTIALSRGISLQQRTSTSSSKCRTSRPVVIPALKSTQEKPTESSMYCMCKPYCFPMNIYKPRISYFKLCTPSCILHCCKCRLFWQCQNRVCP